ncbi:GNAT family N-acetyltransferase [Aeromicrobium sp. CTD01-1L150]|uniref:GNAT family N-acetyltransferase n=1 Tax=Aeromicrobium sp. CTD01-1L150 TaxID=3341830 RepID=UPI0035C232F8
MTWAEAVELHGRHVRLEPLRAEHAEGVLAAADDDAIFEHLSTARPTTRSDADSLVEHYLRLPASPWAQVDVASGEVAGMTTYYDIDESLRTLAIGYTWLGRRFWRSGINTEAKLLLLTHAFETLGCVRVVWHTDIRNERSQAAIARLGARREGVLRKHKIRRDGTWRDTAQFSMLDDEWPAVRKTLRAALTR